jgi:threonine dehydrogenase-like Zn-dependent dehydrogenase
MKAVAVEVGHKDSVGLRDVAEPPGPANGMLVRTLVVGVCGTDREIISGSYGKAPPGEDHLIIGHESLGVVEDAPVDSRFAPGDHVAGIVRRPDPVPCDCCERGDWDMCLNGRFTERGIKGLHGFAAERFTIESGFAVKVDSGLGPAGVLIEPASILAKAWSRIDSFSSLMCSSPTTVLVTGAGPIGLLAALLGVQRGLDVHVLDRVTSGPKPELVRSLGATYHSGGLKDALPGADITLECTGAGALVFEAIRSSGRNGIVCLTGVSALGHQISVDAGAVNRDIVLENDIVFGSVNANRGDYEAAARVLAAADRAWLQRLITREVPLDRWREAYTKQEGDVKTVLRFE